MGLALLTIFTAVMLTHIIMDEFLLHASTFALAVYLIVSRVLRLISQHVPDALARKRLRRITLFGFCRWSNSCRAPFSSLLIVSKLHLWLPCLAHGRLGVSHIDQDEAFRWLALGILVGIARMVCSSVPALFMTSDTLMTWHRWHIFTAIGGYTAVAVVDMITSGEVNKDATDDLAWPVPLAAKFMSALQDQ